MSESNSLKFTMKIDTEGFRNALGEWRSGLTMDGFKAWLARVRQGEVTREFVEEHYLPVGTSFAELEAKVLMDELEAVFDRAGGTRSKIVRDVHKWAGEEQALQATFDFREKRQKLDDKLLNLVVNHLQVGHDVSFVAFDVDQLQEFRKRLSDKLTMGATPPAASIEWRYGRLDITLVDGSKVFMQSGTYTPQGASAVHTPVLILQDPYNWKACRGMTPEKIRAELEMIAAVDTTKGENRVWIYTTDAYNRIVSENDGISTTFFKREDQDDRPDAATYAMWAGNSQKTLTEKDIREAFDMLPPPGDSPLFLSPQAYRKMVSETILETFKLSPKNVEEVVGKSIAANLSPVLHPPKFVPGEGEGCMLRSSDSEAVAHLKAKYRVGEPSSHPDTKWTAVTLKSEEPMKKTCKDFCTMADLLSHGHNPGCPEKK